MKEASRRTGYKNRRFTDNDIRQIFKDHKTMRNRDLLKKWDTSRSTIHEIINRKTYKNIEA